MEYDARTYRLAKPGRTGPIAAVLAVIGLALCVVGYFVDRTQLFHSWLTSFVFWLTIALGGLFFTMLHHLVGARWSTVLRRLAESIMGVLPVMAVLFLPLLLGLHELYRWSDAETVAADHLLAAKQPFLNTTFFIIRAAGYFVVWIVLARLLFGLSLRQDAKPDHAQTRRARIISAPGMILFALTITFAAFDWLMSLDAHWYSTIFGVYVFAGGFLAALAFLTLLVMWLRAGGALREVVTVEHYHDLGKLMFAFVVFWAYMAFSQYFLIWYGNIPEETVWYLHRWEGSWRAVSLLLVFGHFALPFFLLFPQGTKRNPVILTLMALWLLLMHLVDLHWLVLPSLHHHGIHLSWMDAAAWLGIGGVFVALLWRRLTRHPLVPVGDPALPDSINFINP